jgi:hypothetical protein
MDDGVVERARADLAKLEERESSLAVQLRDVRERADKLRAFLDVYRQYAQTSSVQDVAASAPRPPSRRSKEGLTPGTRGANLEEVAFQAVKRAGRPQEIGQLLAEVRGAGLEPGGARPATNLSSVLSRSNRLRFDRGVGWVLAEWPPPEPLSGFLSSRSESSAPHGREEPRRGGAGAD